MVWPLMDHVCNEGLEGLWVSYLKLVVIVVV